MIGAEWRSGQRVGPITQRSEDRNLPLLTSFFTAEQHKFAMHEMAPQVIVWKNEGRRLEESQRSE